MASGGKSPAVGTTDLAPAATAGWRVQSLEGRCKGTPPFTPTGSLRAEPSQQPAGSVAGTGKKPGGASLRSRHAHLPVRYSGPATTSGGIRPEMDRPHIDVTGFAPLNAVRKCEIPHYRNRSRPAHAVGEVQEAFLSDLLHDQGNRSKAPAANDTEHLKDGHKPRECLPFVTDSAQLPQLPFA